MCIKCIYMLYLKLPMFLISTTSQCPGVIFLFSVLWWAASCKIVFSRSFICFFVPFWWITHTCVCLWYYAFLGFLECRCWSVFYQCIILVQLTEKPLSYIFCRMHSWSNFTIQWVNQIMKHLDQLLSWYDIHFSFICAY